MVFRVVGIGFLLLASPATHILQAPGRVSPFYEADGLCIAQHYHAYQDHIYMHSEGLVMVNFIHDVHQGEEVVLDVLFAMETDHRVIHPQQHLDVVIVFSRVSAVPHRLIQLLVNAAVNCT